MYNNLKSLAKDGTCCMTINRRVAGLYFNGKEPEKDDRQRDICITCSWKDDYLNFSHDIPMLEANGKDLRVTQKP